MRRSVAISLTLLFSWLLVLPLFAAPIASSVPSCCRKGGKHQCAMGMTQASDTGPAISSIAKKCPCFPQVVGVSHIQVCTPAAEKAVVAGLTRRTSVSWQSEAGYHISSDRSRQERGPPSLTRG